VVLASGVAGRDSDWAGEKTGRLDLWQEEEPEMPEGFVLCRLADFKARIH
jgi:hypothetical protein